MSKATAAAPPSTANEVPIDRPPRRQSPPTFDCRAATIKPQTTPLRDNHAPSIMPPPRRRIPILIVAAFSSRSPRDSMARTTANELSLRAWSCIAAIAHLTGRHHPGMAGEIISERRARSNRIGGRDRPGFAGDFPRNPQTHSAAAHEVENCRETINKPTLEARFCLRDVNTEQAPSPTPAAVDSSLPLAVVV